MYDIQMFSVSVVFCHLPVPTMAKDYFAMFHDYFETNSVLNYHATIKNFKSYLKNGFDATCGENPVATVINGVGKSPTCGRSVGSVGSIRLQMCWSWAQAHLPPLSLLRQIT